MNKKILGNCLPLIFCLISGIVFIAPQLRFPYPNLLDITETVHSKEYPLSEAISGSLRDRSRFQPLSSLSKYTFASLFGMNARFYFITFGIILGLTLYLDWQIAGQKNKKIFLLMILLLLVTPITIDVYWRLGTSENLLTMFLLLSVFLAVKGHFPALVLSLLFLLISKETAIFFIPCFIWFLFWKKKYLWTTVLSALLAGYLPLLIPRLINTSSDSYTQLFKIDLARNMLTISRYFHPFPAIFLLLLAATLGYIYTKVKKTCQPEDTFLFLLSWTSLLPVAFFNNVQAYYLFPSLNLTLLFCLRLARKGAKSRLFLLVFLAILISLLSAIKMAKYWSSDYAGDFPLISFLKNNPAGNSQYFAEGRLEYINSIYLLLSNFGKKDISFAPEINEFRKTWDTQGGYGIEKLHQKTLGQFINADGNVILISENPNYAGKTLPLCCKPLFSNIEKCKWFVIEK